MGTNYYLETRAERCSACGNVGAVSRLHIGKGSMGWCFALRVYDDIPDLKAWEALIRRGDRIIVDEYGDQLTADNMMKIISDRAGRSPVAPGSSEWEKKPFGYDSWEHFHSANGSTFGPRGLLRCKIGEHCVGHGDGTYDLVKGEFS